MNIKSNNQSNLFNDKYIVKIILLEVSLVLSLSLLCIGNDSNLLYLNY